MHNGPDPMVLMVVSNSLTIVLSGLGQFGLTSPALQQRGGEEVPAKASRKQ